MYLLSLSCGRLHNSIKAYYTIDKWRYSNYEEKKEASSNATSYCTTCNENDNLNNFPFLWMVNAYNTFSPISLSYLLLVIIMSVMLTNCFFKL